MKESNGWTSLHFAAQFGTLGVIKFLIAKGCDLHATDADGWTPLLVAARNNTVEVLQYLISIVSDVHVKDNYGNTLLHASAWNDTALDLARKRDNTEVAEYLERLTPPTEC